MNLTEAVQIEKPTSLLSTGPYIQPADVCSENFLQEGAGTHLDWTGLEFRSAGSEAALGLGDFVNVGSEAQS